ncbi:MAG: DsbA family protein [Buchnera aphidicola (Meitanaphis elongallis)]
MKKILIIFMLILFGFHNVDAQMIQEKKYSILNKKITNAPQIIEFFSFLCPHCYALEKKYNLDKHIKKQISSSIKIIKYHVNFLGGELGSLLTHIWEMSKIVKLEKKILMPIFEKVQQTKSITNFYTLKNEFLKLTKMNRKEFNFLWNSFVTKSMLYNQNIVQNTINLKYVPSIFINGKYSINSENMNHKSPEILIKEYICIIKFLLKKN